MKKNKRLGQLALAGLLLATSFPIEAASLEYKEVLLAVAGCAAHGCATTEPASPSSQPAPTPPKNANNGQVRTQNPQVADAGGYYSTPSSRMGGGHSTLPHSSSVGGSYGSRVAPGNYTDPNLRNTNVGGSYSVPENRYGSSSEAGSWSGTARTDIGRERVQQYNYNNYNTNRNFETSPSYKGDYLDSSFYSDTVAPYGAPRTEGFDKQYNRDAGYGYEAITTSGIVTQPQLQAMITPEAWNLYLKLDSEGQALALQLASQANFANKDLAVREAYIRMQERQTYMMQKQ